MIIAYGKFQLVSHKRDNALVIMRNMEDMALNEQGCIKYEFYTSVRNPNTVFIYQEWASIDAIQSHFVTDYMKDFLSILPDFLEGDSVIYRFAEQRSVDDMAYEESLMEYEQEAITVH